jgi:radical SAM superfamily enzyme YgiQ (UPF0313 family)
MKVGLVNIVPDQSDVNYLPFNQGLGVLSAVLKMRGHSTALFHFSKSRGDKPLLEAFAPDALFVYLSTQQYPLFVELLADWKSQTILRSTPVIVGGPHPTALPLETAEQEGVDAVCVGEGEVAAVEVCRRLERGDTFCGIDNIWYRGKDGALVKNPIGAHTENLDALPFADREIFPFELLKKSRALNILGLEFMVSRGCPYPCRYCLNPLVASRHGRSKPRLRSPKSAVDEIAQVVRRFGHRGIIGFVDDVLTCDPDWLEELGGRYRAEVGLPFWCNSRVDTLDEKTVKILRRAGCSRIYVGIECGDEKLRRRVLGKRISNEMILDRVALVKKQHIKLVTYFMMGLPGETEEHIQKSMELCDEIEPDWLLLSMFWPYPGTALYDELVEKKEIDPHYYRTIAADTFYSAEGLDFPSRLDTATLRRCYEDFTLRFR